MEYDESVLIKRSDGEPVTAAVDKPMTFHCAKCNTLLADSFGVCGESKCLDSIACLRVTKDVVIADASKVGHKGELANCSVKCCDCCSTVGKVILSAPSHLAALRSLVLLCKANLNCYILDSSSMVKASTLTFDLKPLRDDIDMVMQQFEAKMDQMLCIRDRLAERSGTSELYVDM
ncbi:protein Mis18-beta isoform X2 [Betta splendens]|uniref:Protein Mis18-beta isoform X2 n=1 Tax=Betta splendens TaxID=158456 RepID=A0A8M1H984_BETSP|nr:protein Mis18-beta isoform X2 [Betta splendens]